MRKYFAEFIGTFLLTFLACGVASPQVIRDFSE